MACARTFCISTRAGRLTDARGSARSIRNRAATVRERFAPAICLAVLLSGCAHRYRVEGMVLGVEPARQTMVVSHRAIPGFMPAMVMPIRVERATDLAALHPGSRVSFELAVRKSGSVARNVRRQAALVEGVVGDGGAKIRLEPPPEAIAVGAPMPDFQLIDQLARPARLSDFRGSVVAVNFIYTRCPLPDVCPRLAANFARLQRRFRDRPDRSGLVLCSVTLDPQYDTTEILSGYAKKWQADAGVWRFLTGPIEEIQMLARRFGLIYWPEEGLLTHTSSTGVIGRDGRLAALVQGSSYDAAQLGDLIARLLEEQNP